MVFQKPGRNSEKKLEEILKIIKTWRKFRKPGESFQKSYGHPVYTICGILYNTMEVCLNLLKFWMVSMKDVYYLQQSLEICFCCFSNRLLALKQWKKVYTCILHKKKTSIRDMLFADDATVAAHSPLHLQSLMDSFAN